MVGYETVIGATLNYFSEQGFTEEDLGKRGLSMVVRMEKGSSQAIINIRDRNTRWYTLIDGSGNVDQMRFQRDENHELPQDPKTTLGKDLCNIIKQLELESQLNEA